jgi:hypothetical protein
MQIDGSDEQAQEAEFSMRESVEPRSNVTLESLLHSQKQHLQKISTDEGMQMDDSDEQE